MSTNPFTQQAPIEGVKKIILVGSGKGGVGKSTLAANLALALKQSGLKVGLLDADIYGPSIPRLFGAINQKISLNAEKKMEPIVRHGLKIMSMGFLTNEGQAVVWRGPMLVKAFEQFFREVAWGELDFLVIDLPPGTGDVAITIAQKVPVTGGIVVSTPQNLSLVDAKKAIDMFVQLHIPLLGVIENMAFMQVGSERIQLFPRGEMDTYLDAHGIKKLAQIPFDTLIGMSSEAGMPCVISDSTSETAGVFMKLAAGLNNV